MKEAFSCILSEPYGIFMPFIATTAYSMYKFFKGDIEEENTFSDDTDDSSAETDEEVSHNPSSIIRKSYNNQDVNSILRKERHKYGLGGLGEENNIKESDEEEEVTERSRYLRHFNSSGGIPKCICGKYYRQKNPVNGKISFDAHGRNDYNSGAAAPQNSFIGSSIFNSDNIRWEYGTSSSDSLSIADIGFNGIWRSTNNSEDTSSNDNCYTRTWKINNKDYYQNYVSSENGDLDIQNNFNLSDSSDISDDGNYIDENFSSKIRVRSWSSSNCSTCSSDDSDSGVNSSDGTFCDFLSRALRY